VPRSFRDQDRSALGRDRAKARINRLAKIKASPANSRSSASVAVFGRVTDCGAGAATDAELRLFAGLSLIFASLLILALARSRPRALRS
jgi:hypothetical protein